MYLMSNNLFFVKYRQNQTRTKYLIKLHSISVYVILKLSEGLVCPVSRPQAYSHHCT